MQQVTLYSSNGFASTAVLYEVFMVAGVTAKKLLGLTIHSAT